MQWAPDSTDLWAPDSERRRAWASDSDGHLTLIQAIDLFLAAKAAEGISPKTTTWYRMILARLGRAFESGQGVDGVTAPALRSAESRPRDGSTRSRSTTSSADRAWGAGMGSIRITVPHRAAGIVANAYAATLCPTSSIVTSATPPPTYRSRVGAPRPTSRRWIGALPTNIVAVYRAMRSRRAQAAPAAKSRRPMPRCWNASATAIATSAVWAPSGSTHR